MEFEFQLDLWVATALQKDQYQKKSVLQFYLKDEGVAFLFETVVNSRMRFTRTCCLPQIRKRSSREIYLLTVSKNTSNDQNQENTVSQIFHTSSLLFYYFNYQILYTSLHIQLLMPKTRTISCSSQHFITFQWTLPHLSLTHHTLDWITTPAVSVYLVVLTSWFYDSLIPGVTGHTINMYHSKNRHHRFYTSQLDVLVKNIKAVTTV